MVVSKLPEWTRKYEKKWDLTRSVRCCGRKDGWDFCLLRSHPTKWSPERNENIDTRYEGQAKSFTCIKSTSVFQPSRSSSARSASSLKPFSVYKTGTTWLSKDCRYPHTNSLAGCLMSGWPQPGWPTSHVRGCGSRGLPQLPLFPFWDLPPEKNVFL